MNTLAASLTVEELKRDMERCEVQAIDVRSVTEFAAGHAAGAVNIPLDQIECRLADLNRGTWLALICQSGGRASLCRERLAARGLVNDGVTAIRRVQETQCDLVSDA